MNKKSYHHGDLRNIMIEKGLEIITEEGKGSLSLRKLAAACGVSHAAPYAHFADKKGLMDAILEHITEQFSAVLQAAIDEHGVTKKGLFHLSYAYVMFFGKNPNYFEFIFNVAEITIDRESSYEPYDIFKSLAKELVVLKGYTPENGLRTLLAHWALMHGLAAIACMAGNEPEEIEAWTREILLKNHILYLEDSTC